MNHSTPGLPVHHQLLEITQTHVHRVGDAIQPSHLLLSSSPAPIPPSIRVFPNESTLCMRWPKFWSFSFSISPSNEHQGLITFRMDWLDLLAVQGTLKSLLQHHSSKASILQCSAFFTVQLSHPYMTTGKTIAFVGKVMSLLFIFFLFLFFLFFIYYYYYYFLFVVNFVIHWNETSLSLHVFPIPIPPPTSLSTRSLQVFPEHQVRALVSCIQPGLVICFTLDRIHVSMLFSWNIPPSPSPTESKWLFYKSVSFLKFYFWANTFISLRCSWSIDLFFWHIQYFVKAIH